MLPSFNTKATFDVFMHQYQNIEYANSELSQPIEKEEEDAEKVKRLSPEAI